MILMRNHGFARLCSTHKLKTDPKGFMKACDRAAKEIRDIEDKRILEEIYATLSNTKQKDRKNKRNIHVDKRNGRLSKRTSK